MEPLTFNMQSTHLIDKNTTNPDSGRYNGMGTSEVATTRHTETKALLNEAPSLKDRLIYPLRAAKKRIINMAGIGLAAGYYAPTIGTGAILGLVGNFIGSTIGRLIQCLFLPGSETNPGDYGAGVGFYAGIFLALPAGFVLGAVAAAAFAVIGLVGNIITLPVDIYNAKTLNNKEDLYPEPLMAKAIWHAIKEFRFNDIAESL